MPDLTLWKVLFSYICVASFISVLGFQRDSAVPELRQQTWNFTKCTLNCPNLIKFNHLGSLLGQTKLNVALSYPIVLEYAPNDQFLDNLFPSDSHECILVSDWPLCAVFIHKNLHTIHVESIQDSRRYLALALLSFNVHQSQYQWPTSGQHTQHWLSQINGGYVLDNVNSIPT